MALSFWCQKVVGICQYPALIAKTWTVDVDLSVRCQVPILLSAFFCFCLACVLHKSRVARLQVSVTHQGLWGLQTDRLGNHIQQMPSGKEQSQVMSPQASRILSQTACYHPMDGGKDQQKELNKKKKPHQMCMEELSHHVRRDGASFSSHYQLIWRQCEQQSIWSSPNRTMFELPP